MDLPTTCIAKVDEIFLQIASYQGSGLNIVDLYIFGPSPGSASPAIRTRALLAKPFNDSTQIDVPKQLRERSSESTSTVVYHSCPQKITPHKWLQDKGLWSENG